MSYAIEKDWTTESGLRAIVMMTDLGHRCGYVGIGTDHPLFCVEYSELHPSLTKGADELNSPECVFKVHGGITYSGYGGGEYPVASNLWWFGYDCAHAGDLPAPDSELAKRYASSGMDREGEHRTLEFCIAECESLATQLKGVGA